MSVAIGAHPPLEAAYGVTRDQTIPVHAHEARAEFLFQAGERLLEEELPIGGAYRYIFELRFEVDDFVDGNEHHPRSLGHRQKAARGGRQAVELGVRKWLEPRYFLQRAEEALNTYRLHQIIDGVHFERRDRVLVVCGRKDQHWRKRQLEQMARELDAIHIRHVNVGKHQVRGRRAEQMQRLAPTAGFADNQHGKRGGAIVQQLAQASAGGSLVIDQHDSQRCFSHAPSPDSTYVRYGMRMCTS